MQSVKKSGNPNMITPLTEEELNKRIDQAESDFENNRFVRNAQLLAKYQ